MRYWVRGIAPVHKNRKTDIFEVLVLGKTVLTQICIPKCIRIKETRIIQIEGNQFSTNELIRRYAIITEKEKSPERNLKGGEPSYVILETCSC